MIHIYIESGLEQAKRYKKETTNEFDFLRKFLAHHFPNLTYGTDYDIIGLGGYTKLNASLKILEIASLKDKHVVLFDADTEINNGGFSKRHAELLQLKVASPVDFDLFLWPNNHDDGDFESLLLQMINIQHAGILECFENFVRCVGGHDPEEKLYEIPDRKSEIYTYIGSMKKSRKEKENFSNGYWMFDRPDLWNLDAEGGRPLYEFFKNLFLV